tara:strand:+ start:9959 stop:10297 length:339 start_codon:yes stop_codon:yes gene_type:complete
MSTRGNIKIVGKAAVPGLESILSQALPPSSVLDNIVDTETLEHFIIHIIPSREAKMRWAGVLYASVQGAVGVIPIGEPGEGQPQSMLEGKLVPTWQFVKYLMKLEEKDLFKS